VKLADHFLLICRQISDLFPVFFQTLDEPTGSVLGSTIKLSGKGEADFSTAREVTTIKRKRLEITFFEQERIIRKAVIANCSVCQLSTEMLTPEQAGELAQVEVQSIYRWLEQGRAHGMKTTSGQDRVCKNSL
jgi:hypothetical protein